MKRTAMQHTKMRRLVRALKVPQYAAVGILESLWQLAARETPEGDIGRLSNDDIADWFGWDDSADALIDGLVQCGWLDADTRHRLIVHDWSEHADDAVDNALARSGKRYADGNIPRMGRLSTKERDAICAKHGWVPSAPRTTDSPEVEVPGIPCAQNATASALPVPEPVPEARTPLPPSQASGESGEEQDDEPEGVRGVVLAMPSHAPDAGGVPREPMLGEKSACAAVQRVMRECDWSDRRLAPVIEQALRQHRERTSGPDLLTSADLMIRGHREFMAHAHLMKYTLGPRKFIVQGLWVSDAMWPIDHARLAQARRM